MKRFTQPPPGRCPGWVSLCPRRSSRNWTPRGECGMSTPAAIAGTVASRSAPKRWAVFAILFALMVVDYLDRQVVVSMFPHLKAQWNLSDSELRGAAVARRRSLGPREEHLHHGPGVERRLARMRLRARLWISPGRARRG